MFTRFALATIVVSACSAFAPAAGPKQTTTLPFSRNAEIGQKLVLAQPELDVLPGAARSAQGLIDWLKALIDDSGLPTTLAEADVPQKDLAMLAKDAMFQQRLLINNPREVDETTALRLYHDAWSGWS